MTDQLVIESSVKTDQALKADAAQIADATFLNAYFGTPEMQLLLGCCKRHIGSLDEVALASLMASPFDEIALFERSREHRLSLLANKILVRPHRHRFSTRIAEAFARESQRLAITQLQLGKAAIDIHAGLSEGEARHLFLKGPALNKMIFGDEVLRYSKDLDILIEIGNLVKADSCLKKLGYEPDKKVCMGSRMLRWERKDLTYRKNGSPFTIELHWKTDKVEAIVVPGLFDWDSQVDYVQVHNVPLPVMADYAHCLYLCLHAAKHHWMRLRWLLDIPLFIRERGLDPEKLLDLASRHGLQNVLMEAFGLAEHLFRLDFGYARLDPAGANAGRAVRRFQLVGESENPDCPGWALIYHRGMLYPGIFRKLTFWLIWGKGESISRLSQAKARIRSLFVRASRPTP